MRSKCLSRARFSNHPRHLGNLPCGGGVAEALSTLADGSAGGAILGCGLILLLFGFVRGGGGVYAGGWDMVGWFTSATGGWGGGGIVLAVAAGGKGCRGKKFVQCGSKAEGGGCFEAPTTGTSGGGGGAVRGKESEMGATGDLVG